MLNRENLINCFNAAKKSKAKYIGILVEMEGYPERKVNIIPAANFEKDLYYYSTVYDKDLTHKHADGISISGFTYGNSFHDIEEDLLGEEVYGII